MKFSDGLVKIRSFNEDDTNFILNSWLKSFRNSPFAQNIAPYIYYTVQKRIIEDCIRNHDIRVICVADDSSHIVGYACFSEIADGLVNIDYIYIKSPYRRFGLAKELVKDIRSNFPGDMKFKTDAVTSVATRICPKLDVDIDHMGFSARFYVFKIDKAS